MISKSFSPKGFQSRFYDVKKSFVKSIILNPASHENSSPWICMQILLKAASLQDKFLFCFELSSPKLNLVQKRKGLFTIYGESLFEQLFTLQPA